MNKRVILIMALLTAVDPAWSGKGSEVPEPVPVVRFGIITDVHHTNKPDTPLRKHSAALKKMRVFAETMNRLKADFVIQLGDIVDGLAGDRDPLENLAEVTSRFAAFSGPRYHVIGNHDFDNMTREQFLKHIDNTGIPRGRTWYSFDKGEIHCVVLDAGYTAEEPHRPFDLQDPQNPYWDWKDAWVPREQLDWLEADLAKSDLPTVVFTHQVLHRDETEDHTIKNAAAVRGILEEDGQVLAVFSGHDHRGETAVVNGIRYLVLRGNVGIRSEWDLISPTGGVHPRKDSPFALVEIREEQDRDFNGRKSYLVTIVGNAQQYSFEDRITIRR